jgi:hypothetical protein
MPDRTSAHLRACVLPRSETCAAEVVSVVHVVCDGVRAVQVFGLQEATQGRRCDPRPAAACHLCRIPFSRGSVACQDVPRQQCTSVCLSRWFGRARPQRAPCVLSRSRAPSWVAWTHVSLSVPHRTRQPRGAVVTLTGLRRSVCHLVATVAAIAATLECVVQPQPVAHLVCAGDALTDRQTHTVATKYFFLAMECLIHTGPFPCLSIIVPMYRAGGPATRQSIWQAIWLLGDYVYPLHVSSGTKPLGCLALLNQPHDTHARVHARKSIGQSEGSEVASGEWLDKDSRSIKRSLRSRQADSQRDERTDRRTDAWVADSYLVVGAVLIHSRPVRKRRVQHVDAVPLEILWVRSFPRKVGIPQYDKVGWSRQHLHAREGSQLGNDRQLDGRTCAKEAVATTVQSAAPRSHQARSILPGSPDRSHTSQQRPQSPVSRCKSLSL